MNKNHFYILIILLFILSCNKGKQKLYFSCEKKNNFCLEVLDTTQIDKRFTSIEKLFIKNKFIFLKSSKYWINFDMSKNFVVKIENKNNKIEYYIVKNKYSLDDYNYEIVSEYLNELSKYIKKKLLLNDGELLIIRGIHFPLIWNKKDEFPPPPSFNEIPSRESLYYINDNFNL